VPPNAHLEGEMLPGPQFPIVKIATNDFPDNAMVRMGTASTINFLVLDADHRMT
jgi:hypothetical protein